MSEGTLTIAIPICDSPAASGTMVYSDFGNEVIEQDVGDLETSLVGDHQRQQQFDALIHRVESFLRLEIDWDAYGGVAAAPLSVEFARQLLQRIQAVAELNPPTSCSPISTGLMLEWELRGAKLYFEIDEESVLCAIRLNGLLQFRYEDVSFDVQRAFVTAKKFHQADV